MSSWFGSWREEWGTASLREEASAALTVTLMSVPQGVAYALIAGLPPAMGLYAGALPAILGSLLRSSRHVVSGPTNALSLLVGTSVAAQFPDPVVAAATLALMVGAMQLLAAGLRLSAIVDYVSAAVVTGYITGAGILIGVGQLKNLTATSAAPGNVLEQVQSWVLGLHEAHGLTVALSVGTIVAILVARRWVGRSGAAMGAIAVGMATAWLFDLGSHGVQLVRDLASIPQGLPPLSLPDLSLVSALFPVALAGVLLSLVESTSVARSIAGRSGQRLDLGREFLGMGVANAAAGLFGAFPVSGSLSRSALNEQAGAKTRFAGAASGVFMLVVLAGLGPLVDLIPIASLAGLLMVVAVDLVDVRRIRRLLLATMPDRLAFLGTLVGTWFLPLDQAIGLGVGINLVVFLRQSQALLVRELWVDDDLRLREVDPDDELPDKVQRCGAIRVLHLEGPLFFGAAGALEDALSRAIAEPAVQVVVVRLKRARGLDFTTAEVFAAAHRRLAAQGRTLLMVGLRANMMETLERSGLAATFGEDHVYPTQPGWFVAMNEALTYALSRVRCEHDCTECPVERYVHHRREHPRLAR